MKMSNFFGNFVLLLVFINNVQCIRNLFLPRTGDISGITSQVIAENLSNATNFQSLLSAGRSLAYPFSAGVLLAITSIANENNWKVSDSGFSKVLGIPREEIVDSYGALLEMLDTDENVTLSNTLFSFQSKFNPSEALTDTLMTDVREASWTRETWLKTYQSMVEHLGNVTNEKIDTLLIPSVTKIGTPFRKTTEAVVLSTFHYINGWQYPWTDAELGKFAQNEGIPFLKVEEIFYVAEEEEYTAVSVPLGGGSKNIVFVLPHVNITSKYFRNQADAEEDDEPTDVVPFPKSWKLKKLRLRVPTFNTTDANQFGEELGQIGMNETFCTIIRDYFGRYPYYLRPMVQVNFLDFNDDFLELASATGVAVEKFQSFFTVVTGGNETKDEDDDIKKAIAQQNPSKHLNQVNSLPHSESNKFITKASLEADQGNGSITTGGQDTITIDNGTYTTNIPTLSFDRPFLWYLNDSEVGPMYFGTVENLLNLAYQENSTEPVWLVSFSMGTSLFLSPIWVSICMNRSTRLTAVFGGLVTSLACLFTSFASQFHQTFISFGIILSVGIGLSRDGAFLIVCQYFKRRKDFVEVFLVAGSGFGILVMTLIVHSAISGLGWRFGLQALTGGIFSTFFLATCYRSASLYHPQRRAILHLKNQKRKIKEKGKHNDRPPFLDYSCLNSRSVQLLILSTTFTSFGCYSPLFHLALECTKVQLPIAQVIYLYVYIGAGWILGSCLFGLTVLQRNEDCRISKPYLLQGSTLIIAGALFALATFYEEQGLGSFCWIYGFGLGSYNYVLKAWTYEKTRAKNFGRAWSYVQSAQGMGVMFGVPATGYMNHYAGWRTGYFLSSGSVFFSVMIMLCCGMRRRQLMRNKSGTSSMKTCETFDSSGMQSPTVRRISFTFPDEPISPRMNSKGSNRSTGSSSLSFMRKSSGGGVSSDRPSGGSGSINSGSASANNFALSQHQQQPLLLQEQPLGRTQKELTCISEEGILEPHGPV